MTSVKEQSERDKYKMINFEETELRLGLPGNAIANNDDADCAVKNSNNWCTGGKRGFSDTTVTVDLKLNLSSSSNNTHSSSPDNLKDNNTNTTAAAASVSPPNDPAKPPAKAQVVGWPPVRSFRKNIVTVQKKKEEESSNNNNNNNNNKGATLVKVSMDGAPYLRKVDLKMYKSYHQLSDALANMFSSFTSQAHMTDFINQTKLIHLLNGSDYVPTYQDNDRDWMLLGDVPWDMFVESCKRIRIMKGSEAVGLAPRAVEKCKNRI